MHEKECFFISPIGEEGSDVRKRADGVLNFVVRKAATELGLETVRADHISKPGHITLQVIEHVMQAGAVVADLTGLNPNVFYELAIRHAVKKPVVLMAEKGTKLPFDIAQMRTIFIDSTDLGSADECRSAIVNHMRESLKDPAADSPMATVVDIQTLKGGNVLEQNVAELIGAVAEVTQLSRQSIDLAERTFFEMQFGLFDPMAAEQITMMTHQLRQRISHGVPAEELIPRLAELEEAVSRLDRRRRPHRRRLPGGARAVAPSGDLGTLPEPTRS